MARTTTIPLDATGRRLLAALQRVGLPLQAFVQLALQSPVEKVVAHFCKDRAR